MITYKLLTGLLILLFISCNQNQHEKASTQNVQEVQVNNVKPEAQMSTDTTAPTPSSLPPGEPKQKNSPPASSKAPESKPDWNKKIIKTATLNIEVKDYKTFNGKVAQAANQLAAILPVNSKMKQHIKLKMLLP